MMTNKTKHLSTLTGAALVLTATAATPADAQPAIVWEYAVKVVCGKIEPGRRGPLAGGQYFTAVNVHNPGATAVVRRKVAIAGPGEPGRITRFATGVMRNDEAVEFDCEQIQRQADAEWVKGFLVIQSSHQLDVVAVYTTSGRDEMATSFHTERVPPRRMP